MTNHEWYAQAAEKLSVERKNAKYDRYAKVMESAVYETLKGFCRQDAEFAQAVAQGGSFEACMQEVAKNCRESLSDLDAYRRAVRFYFPGADVRFQMTVDLCADVAGSSDAAESPDTAQETAAPTVQKILRLEDFL